jgi:hypothetical protein
MAVPSSGILHLSKIANEKHFDNYNQAQLPTPPYSLTDISTSGNSNGSGVSFDATNTANASADRPDGSAPHAMSEFYNYDHDKVSGNAYITYLQFSRYSSNQINSWGLANFHSGAGTSAFNGTLSSATITAICGENDRSLNSTSLAGFNTATSNSEGTFQIEVVCSGSRILALVYVDDDADMEWLNGNF